MNVRRKGMLLNSRLSVVCALTAASLLIACGKKEDKKPTTETPAPSAEAETKETQTQEQLDKSKEESAALQAEIEALKEEKAALEVELAGSSGEDEVALSEKIEALELRLKDLRENYSRFVQREDEVSAVRNSVEFVRSSHAEAASLFAQVEPGSLAVAQRSQALLAEASQEVDKATTALAEVERLTDGQETEQRENLAILKEMLANANERLAQIEDLNKNIEIVGSFVAGISPEQLKFEHWCAVQEALPESTQKTIKALYQVAKSQRQVVSVTNCQEAGAVFERESGVKEIHSGLDGLGLSDLRPLKTLRFVSTLNLADNEIEDVSPLGQLSQLERVYLTNNRITTVAPLAQLPRLAEGSLANNPIAGQDPQKCPTEGVASSFIQSFCTTTFAR